MISFAHNVEGHLWRQACRAIRRGEFTRARAMFSAWDEPAHRDAACLNVLGVLAVAESDWKHAAKLWRAAVHTDAGYQPAQQNLRRYYELFQFGRSEVAIALGDEADFNHVR